MDFFSFLPIIIIIYAIVTMFNPKNKTPRNKRQNPFPFQGTWMQKIEELERQMFPQEVAVKPPTNRGEPMMRSSSEGFGSEGYISQEGTSGTEGTWGTEGTPGTEGTWESDTLKLSPQDAPTKQPEKQQNPMSLPRITEESLMQGVIWAEVLGKPRARGGWSRRH
ncbi:hypothetical protein ACHOLT_10655 [Desulfitobacterium sp. Sab5]|uniref:hypothetical protein n=1 Tax=Desulfitobacterium nosdiversum TaxID=3375356 RepID=UPI003CE7FCC8